MIHSTAKAKEVNIVERSIADAVGLNLDIQNTKGIMIANFGGETTELSVLAGGGMVLNRLVKVGGHTFDQGIINLVKHSHDFLIGRQTAEVLRRNFNVFTGDSDSILSVAGRDLITGVPMRKPVSIMLIRAAMKDPLLECVKAIHSLLDRTPPEVRKAIYENGIFLTGGLANMPGLEIYIEQMVGIKSRTALEPDTCAVNGLERLRELYKLDENYSDYKKVGAHVISNNGSNWFSDFTIDKGKKDGIKKNCNVLAGSGLVGIVTEVGPHYARVRSIIDDESNISAMLLSTSDTCVVRGDLKQMENGRIRFEKLANNDNKIEVGEQVVTSHVSDRFLQGLFVGYVSEVKVDSNNLTRSGYITPAVDFTKLQEVLVITTTKNDLIKQESANTKGE